MAIRRPVVFTGAVALVSFIASLLWVAPYACRPEELASIFATALQESFFYDVFSWIAASWLLSFVCGISSWQAVSRFGQWIGLILISLDEVTLLAQLPGLSQSDAASSSGVWFMPVTLQLWLIGYYLAFFVLPSLIKNGQYRLTGIATLAIVLPWLAGKEQMILGSQVLTKFF